MSKRVLLVALAVFAMNPSYGASSCEAQATDKKLSGAARTSFLSKCRTDAAAAIVKTCDAQAAEKKLAGAAQTSFTTKCVTDAATESCEAEANARKLSGAAKSSFTTKCVKDASAG